MSDPERALSALATLDPGMLRDEWLKIGMAAKAAGLEFEDFNAWSAQAASYDEAAARSTWRSIRPDGRITAGTLFHRAREAGWVDPGARPGRQRKTPLSAHQALQALTIESNLVAIAACNVARGVVLTDADRARLLQAASRCALVRESFA
jgi:hypothetical protein